MLNKQYHSLMDSLIMGQALMLTTESILQLTLAGLLSLKKLQLLEIYFSPEELDKDGLYYAQLLFGHFCLFLGGTLFVVYLVTSIIPNEFMKDEQVAKRFGIVFTRLKGKSFNFYFVTRRVSSCIICLYLYDFPAQ